VRFRIRVLFAMIAVAIGPLLAIAIGVRHELDRRLTAQYAARAAGFAAITGEDLAHESATIADRLASLRSTMSDDNRLRLAVALRSPSERPYLLDFASQAMRLTGLSTLQIQDEDGRVLSSGHFRNEFDRLEPDLPSLLRSAPGGAAIVDARTADGPIRVIARVDSLRLAGRPLTIVGGIAVSSPFLRALAPDTEFSVTLVTDTVAWNAKVAPTAAEAQTTRPMEGAALADSAMGKSPGRVVVAALPYPFIGATAGTSALGNRSLQRARFVITHSDAELADLRRSVDRWVAGAMLVGIVVALVGAGWLAAQVSRPLSQLAEQTDHIDLDRLDVSFASDRTDEVGDLSRLLDTMTRRLRASAARVRDAEHRATVGDLARQVTHDVKNGLVPIRHVLRHLAQVEREEPQRLGAIFAERRPTLDASVEYLDALARNYARLSRPLTLQACDLNVMAREAAACARADDRVSVGLRLDARAPIVAADALVLRRILDNLVTNAIDAVIPTRGTVTIGTDGADSTGARIVVADTGPGMTEAQLAQAFDDFRTTKPNGTGLGLSIVRRLTNDLHATLRVETAPGRGTVVEVGFSP